MRLKKIQKYCVIRYQLGLINELNHEEYWQEMNIYTNVYV